MSEEIVVLLVMLIISSSLLLLVSFVLRHRREVREMLSRERIAAIEKDMEIPWEMEVRRPRRAWRLHLKSGVVLVGAGLGLAVASVVMYLMMLSSTDDVYVVLAWGLFFTTLGGVNIAYDFLVGRKEWERTVALDEAVTRAYIRRLEGNGAKPDHEGTGDDRADS